MINALVTGLATVSILSSSLLPLADIYVDVSDATCATGTGTETDPVCSINAALALAVNGDTIFIAPGTYLENIEFGFAQSVDLIGTNGASVTIIDGGGAGSVLTVPTSVSATIRGLTLTNGLNTHGGGIDLSGYLTIINTTISGNRSTEFGGGGIGSTQGFGIVHVQNSTITGNTAAYYGGGISVPAGTLHLTDSVVSGNTSQGSGGGIHTWGGRLFVTNSTISNNSAVTGAGGGIDASYYSRIDLQTSTLSGNSATLGGGLNFAGQDLDAANCTLSGNSAQKGGGLAITQTEGIHSLENLTISGNSATSEGGGVYSGNYAYSYQIQVRNTIIAQNTSGPGNLASADIGGTLTSLGHNFIGAGGDGFTDGLSGDQVGSAAAVINPFLLPLSANGGPTQTHALFQFSPAIDAGDPLVFSAIDQRGLARPQGAASDIGAFEEGLFFGPDELCNGNGGDQMGCTNCPCGNDSPAGTVGGCINSSGLGALLTTSGQPSISLPPGSQADLRFGLGSTPPNAFCILFSGDQLGPNNVLNPCFGMESGVQAAGFDGLRCAVMNTRRHGGRAADLNGEVGVTNNPWGGEGPPHLGIAKAAAGFAAGQTRYFQAVVREEPTAICMRGLNTSQAVKVTFLP